MCVDQQQELRKVALRTLAGNTYSACPTGIAMKNGESTGIASICLWGRYRSNLFFLFLTKLRIIIFCSSRAQPEARCDTSTYLT